MGGFWHFLVWKSLLIGMKLPLIIKPVDAKLYGTIVMRVHIFLNLKDSGKVF